MTDQEKIEIDQLIEIWDNQGEGKLVLTKDRNGRKKYFITKCGEFND